MWLGGVHGPSSVDFLSGCKLVGRLRAREALGLRRLRGSPQVDPVGRCRFSSERPYGLQ